jgi:hypothetical protein
MELNKLKGGCLLILFTLLIGSFTQDSIASSTPKYEYTGMQIDRLDPNEEKLERMIIKGSFRIYVKKGAEKSTWAGFPKGILYTFINTDTNIKYTTKLTSKLAMAYKATPKKKAKGSYQEKSFKHNLIDFIPTNFPTRRGEYEVYATWLGRDSEIVKIRVSGR